MVDGRTIQLYFEFAHECTRANTKILQEELGQKYKSLDADLNTLNPDSLAKLSLLTYLKSNRSNFHTPSSSKSFAYDEIMTDLMRDMNQISFKDKTWFLINNEEISVENIKIFKINLQKAFHYLNEVRYFQIPEIATSLITLHGEHSHEFDFINERLNGMVHLNINDSIFGHVEKLLEYAANHLLNFFLLGLDITLDSSTKMYLTYHFALSLKYFFYLRLNEIDAIKTIEEHQLRLISTKMNYMIAILNNEEQEFTNIVTSVINNEWLTEILMKNYPREGRFDVYSTG